MLHGETNSAYVLRKGRFVFVSNKQSTGLFEVFSGRNEFCLRIEEGTICICFK